jgi:hypothetical protein
MELFRSSDLGLVLRPIQRTDKCDHYSHPELVALGQCCFMPRIVNCFWNRRALPLGTIITLLDNTPGCSQHRDVQKSHTA